MKSPQLILSRSGYISASLASASASRGGCLLALIASHYANLSPHLQNPSPLELYPAQCFTEPVVFKCCSISTNCRAKPALCLILTGDTAFHRLQKFLGNRSWGAHLVLAHSYCSCQHPVWPAINSTLHLWFRATPHPSSRFSMFLSSVFHGIDPRQELRPDPWTALSSLSNQQHLSYTHCELLSTQEHQTVTHLPYPSLRSAIWPHPSPVNKLIPRTSNF